MPSPRSGRYSLWSVSAGDGFSWTETECPFTFLLLLSCHLQEGSELLLIKTSTKLKTTKLMASQCAYLAYVSTKISHMNHKPSKSSVSIRTHSSLPVSHLPSYTFHTVIHVLEYSLHTQTHHHICTNPYKYPSLSMNAHSCNITTNM